MGVCMYINAVQLNVGKPGHPIAMTTDTRPTYLFIALLCHSAAAGNQSNGQ